MPVLQRTILNYVTLSHILKPYLKTSILEPWNGCEAKILEARGISAFWPIHLDSKMNVSPKYTIKPVLNGHSKIDKTKILMTNGNIMKVESIAECSFCTTFELH